MNKSSSKSPEPFVNFALVDEARRVVSKFEFMRPSVVRRLNIVLARSKSPFHWLQSSSVPDDFTFRVKP